MMRAHLVFERWYTRHFVHPQLDAVGEGTEVFKPWALRLHGPNIRLGRFVHVACERTNEVELVVWRNGDAFGEISVGDHALILPGVRLSSATSVRIGASCMLASGVTVSDADWHDIHDRSREVGRTAPVVLGDNVWLGVGSYVGKGVTIGENSIVGAHAVVTRDVPPNVVAAGNPARVRRSLDPALGFVTRAALFPGTAAEMAVRDDYLRRLVLGGNTFAGWLRATLWPRRSD